MPIHEKTSRNCTFFSSTLCISGFKVFYVKPYFHKTNEAGGDYA